jgi:putative flippase GtrA
LAVSDANLAADSEREAKRSGERSNGRGSSRVQGEGGTEAASMPAKAPLWRRIRSRSVLLQFIQFCMVGAVSTVLNLTIFNLLMAQGLGVNLSHVCAFSLAVTNGFMINRAWTFRRARSHKAERQYMMFIAVNLVGLCLSWAIMRLVGYWLLKSGMATTTVQLFHEWTGKTPVLERWAYSLGELTATPICAVWNFSANRLWTFGGKRGA